ncbi:hypothetical protein QBC34DRAFT_451388 [Podospora aff. communis PSN243]|uniref:DUF3533 domain-containing protein n=1 Tax=Podospora aff. communis PSN243 TaxID=3040156 RepID=A0AAV9GB83_9PEZI|nr:hypothetical protein QBC34DRAFT_451388 [Podospora aff. communis PSN243]
METDGDFNHEYTTNESNHLWPRNTECRPGPLGQKPDGMADESAAMSARQARAELRLKKARQHRRRMFSSGPLASFGALVMISGLLTSTLTQQAVSYPLREASSHNNSSEKAQVDRATTFSAYNGNTMALAAHDSLREQQAIFNGAFQAPGGGLDSSNDDNMIAFITPTCSSGECVWPRYGTLAICGSVANLTALGNSTLLESLASKTEKRLAVLYDSSRATAEALGYDLPSTITHVYPVVIGALDAPTGAFNASVTALLASDSFVAYTDELLENRVPFDMGSVKYLEVAFWWCTKALETSVVAGVARTVEVGTRSEVPWNPEYYQCYTRGTCNSTYGGRVVALKGPPGAEMELEEEEREEEYTVHLWTGLSASALLATSMFDSVFLDRTRGNVAANGAGIAQALGLAILGDFLATKSPEPEEQMSNARRLVSNVATSTTNLIRSGNTRLNKTDTSAIVIGTVKTRQAFVEIRWEWMAMVAVQLALTALFLILTMVFTHRAHMQVIKCSSLATLVALDGNTRDHIGGIDDLEGLKENAPRLAVRLQRGTNGIAVWLGMMRHSTGPGLEI